MGEAYPGKSVLYFPARTRGITPKTKRKAEPVGQREEALELLRKQIHAEVLEPYRVQRIAKDGRVVEVSLISTALVRDSGQAYAIATTERAID